MIQKINEFLTTLDGYLGGHVWFVFLLLGTGIFFTVYLGFPQFRYFNHALRIIKGKFDKKSDVGDTSHFQALTTALSGTVGTGNIAGVALAIHLGGPAALFWMLATAFFGMTTKFVEVTISHKYRDVLPDGSISGGPMYYMKKRLNIKLKNNKIIQTGKWIGGFFAIATILSSFGTGSLPQINSISNSIFETFGLKHIITGFVLAVLLALVIIGGIKRIAKVTSRLVPGMAILYFIGAFFVIGTNYDNILPSFASIFQHAFTGQAAIGGFLGAGFAFVFNRGANRGLFSNEAGQGSAPIAHAAAKAHEPVSEGMVAILEPFIDTIVICTLTGLVLLSSGVWNEKIENQFQNTDMVFLEGTFDDKYESDRNKLYNHLFDKESLPLFTGTLEINNGKITDEITLINARSVAEDVIIYRNNKAYTGLLNIQNGKLIKNEDEEKKPWWSVFSGPGQDSEKIIIKGKSLRHSAPLTTVAFKRSFLGDWGQYIVSIGLLLFAFSTAISWSYYGDRAITYLIGAKYVIYYRLFYIIVFFFASFIDTTVIWSLSYITIVVMAIPNLVGILILHKDMKLSVKEYWIDFKKIFPDYKY